MSFKPGDWVQVKPSHDLSPLLRDGKPTRGRVHDVRPDHIEVWIPIGGADVDEHSQAVFYPPGAVLPCEAP